MIAKIAVHGIRDVVVAPAIAETDAALSHHNELLGMLHGKKLQQHLVHDAKNGSVCADAEGECQNRNGGEKRAISKTPECVTYVLSHLLQRDPAPRIARFFLYDCGVPEKPHGR